MGNLEENLRQLRNYFLSIFIVSNVKCQNSILKLYWDFSLNSLIESHNCENHINF